MEQSMTGSSFFRLPPAIRNIVYADVLRVDHQIPIVPPHQRISSRRDCLTQRRGPRNSYSKTPSYNALSLTCRQAYIESIQIYYEVNHFETYTGQAFRDYIEEVPEERLRMIQVLSVRIQRQTNGLDTNPPIRGLYMSPGSCRWTLNNPQLLDPFQNLRALQLRGRFRVNLSASVVINARLMESLVGVLGRRLPRLIQICVETLVPPAYLRLYATFRLEIKETPGWEYSVETLGPQNGYLFPEGRDFNVFECLTREDATERDFRDL